MYAPENVSFRQGRLAMRWQVLVDNLPSDGKFVAASDELAMRWQVVSWNLPSDGKLALQANEDPGAHNSTNTLIYKHVFVFVSGSSS